jgi:hypothetical protein
MLCATAIARSGGAFAFAAYGKIKAGRALRSSD